MKKRLLFAALLSVAAGGMFYQVSWSEEIPVDAPGQEVVDPPGRFFSEGYCEQHPEDKRCRGVSPRPPVDAPGQDVEDPPGRFFSKGYCAQHPEDKRCRVVSPRPPVEAPGQDVEVP